MWMWAKIEIYSFYKNAFESLIKISLIFDLRSNSKTTTIKKVL